MPRFQRLAKTEVRAAYRHLAIERKPELEVRSEPLRIKAEAAVFQFVEHVGEVLADEPGQHEPVVKRRAPSRQLRVVWLAPEAGNQRPQQELLRQAHARVRRHLE